MTLTSGSLPGWCDPEAVYVALDTLLELYSLPVWSKAGLCRDYPTAMFFPALGEQAAPAKDVCRRCPVVNECLNYALSIGPSLQGVWGATSPRDRRHLGKIISSGAC